MLTASVLLLLASGAVQPAFLTDGAPRSVRLVSATLLPDYSGWSVQQLRAEYVRLDGLRPSVGLPLFTLQVGITALAVTFVAFAIALGQFRGADLVAIIAAGLGFTTSAAMISIAGILLWRAYPDRTVFGNQMDEVQRLADQDERDERMMRKWEQKFGPSRPPEFKGPPPAGPPPLPLPAAPPQVSVQVPLLFARF